MWSIKSEITNTPHANGVPLIKQSSLHSHSFVVLQRFCLSSALSSMASSKASLLSDDTDGIEQPYNNVSVLILVIEV